VEPEPASTEEAKPDMLVALHPASVSAEEEPDLAESQPKTRFEARPAEIEDEGDVEPEQSDRAPSPLVRQLRILLAQMPSAEAGRSAAERPPLRALPHPLLRPIEDQLPEVGVPAEEEEPEAELPPPLEVVSEPEPLWREASAEEDTEVVVESCQIRLWRGCFRYQLYVTLSRSDIAFALSPYFRLKDEDAPGAKAMAALRELLDELEAKGWTVTDEGRRWYAYILERPQ
jgi:hypothetical protein